MSAADLIVRLKLQAEEFAKGLQNMSGRMQTFGQNMISMGQTWTRRVTAPIIAGFGLMAKAAMDLEATEAKFNTVFAGMTDVADGFIEKLKELTPVTTTQARNMASGIQDLLVPMGFMREEATNMTGEFMHVIGALANFNSATHTAEDVASAVQSAIIGQYRSLAALGIQLDATTVKNKAVEMGLLEQGEEMTKTIAAQVLMSEIYAQSGDALDAYTEASLDSKTKLGLLKAEIIDFAAELGARFIPMIEKAVEWVRKGVDWFKGLSDSQQTLGMALLALAAAVGPVLIVLGMLIKSVGVIIGVLSFKIILIGLIIAAVVALVAVLVNWAKDNDELMEQIRAIWEQLKEAGTAIFEALRDTIQFVVDAIRAMWEEHGEAIMAVIRPLWEQVVNTITTAIEIIKNVIVFILAIIRGDWTGAWEALKNIGAAIWNYMKNTAENVFNALRAALAAIWQVISSAARQAWANMGQAIVERAQAIRQGIIDAIQRAVDWIRGLPAQAVEWGRALIQGFVDGVKNMANALVNAIKGVINNAIDGAKNLLGISSPAKVFIEYGIDSIRGYIIGLEKMRSGLVNTMRSVLDTPAPGQASGPGMGSGASLAGAGGVNINLRGLFEGANITIGSENDARSLVKQIYEMASGAARSEGYNI